MEEEKIRVQKFVALSGLCSRRNAEELIKEGRVKVNKKVIEIGHSCTKKDKISVDDRLITFNENYIYIILNKSSGYVTTKSDEFGRKTVYDLLKEKDNLSNLFSVGRLDKDTSGLIILTNDGEFTQKVIHPSNKIDKEYIVKIDKSLTQIDRKELENGIFLDDYRLKPVKTREINSNTYVVIISEGRKRQIRNMFEKLNYKVINLHRIKIGGLDLKEFKLNFREYKIVTREFLEKRIFN